jgi:hypothetical protein
MLCGFALKLLQQHFRFSLRGSVRGFCHQTFFKEVESERLRIIVPAGCISSLNIRSFFLLDLVSEGVSETIVAFCPINVRHMSFVS